MELSQKKNEISKVEMILDELNIEVLKIKNNILKNQDEWDKIFKERFKKTPC